MTDEKRKQKERDRQASEQTQKMSPKAKEARMKTISSLQEPINLREYRSKLDPEYAAILAQMDKAGWP